MQDIAKIQTSAPVHSVSRTTENEDVPNVFCCDLRNHEYWFRPPKARCGNRVKQDKPPAPLISMNLNEQLG